MWLKASPRNCIAINLRAVRSLCWSSTDDDQRQSVRALETKLMSQNKVSRGLADFLALLIVLPTNCKYNAGCCALGTGYTTGTTLRNTLDVRLQATVS